MIGVVCAFLATWKIWFYSNYSDDELRFVVFCIESLAEDLNIDLVIVHDALSRESDIVEQYIIPINHVFREWKWYNVK